MPTLQYSPKFEFKRGKTVQVVFDVPTRRTPTPGAR
jgi:hypothetical protein